VGSVLVILRAKIANNNLNTKYLPNFFKKGLVVSPVSRRFWPFRLAVRQRLRTFAE
jgi:hypothetical protein